MQLFLKRHTELTVRKAQSVSIGQGADNRELLYPASQICQENGLQSNPSKIHSMNKCGSQMKNELDKVVATEGSRKVRHVTSGDKGKTISIIACCNVEIKFLPYDRIFREKTIINSKIVCRLFPT
jgi:hypothetical protein